MGLVQTTPQIPQSTPAPQAAQASQSSPIQDPLLQQVVTSSRGKCPAHLKQAYQQVITASNKVLFSPETSKGVIKRLHMPGSLVHNVSAGVANLMALLSNESKGAMSFPAASIACVEVMAEVLDVAEKTMRIKMTPDIIAACTHATTTAVLEKFGVTQEKIDQAIAAGKSGQTAQPASAGLVSQPQG